MGECYSYIEYDGHSRRILRRVVRNLTMEPNGFDKIHLIKKKKYKIRYDMDDPDEDYTIICLWRGQIHRRDHIRRETIFYTSIEEEYLQDLLTNGDEFTKIYRPVKQVIDAVRRILQLGATTPRSGVTQLRSDAEPST